MKKRARKTIKACIRVLASIAWLKDARSLRPLKLNRRLYQYYFVKYAAINNRAPSIKLIVHAISQKWKSDKRDSPLEVRHWLLYLVVHLNYYCTNQDFPNVVDPRNFNDKINWLKLFWQSTGHIDLCDKLKVKDFVRERVGDNSSPETLAVFERDAPIDVATLPEKFVLKTNHNSSGALVVDKATATESHIKRAVGHLWATLDRPYGFETGEWPYIFIEPKVFAEEYIECDGHVFPPDYKFHCVNGEIAWLEYMYNRAKRTPTEENIAPDGASLNMLFDETCTLGNAFVVPENWETITDFVSKLSSGFKYVRIDIYCVNQTIYVGELTFYPDSGCRDIKAASRRYVNEYFGSLLKLDCTEVRPPSLSDTVYAE